MRSRQDPLGLGNFDFDVKDFPFENLYRPDFIRFLWFCRVHLNLEIRNISKMHLEPSRIIKKRYNHLLTLLRTCLKVEIFMIFLYIFPVSATKNRETFNIFQLLFRNSPSTEEIEQASDDFLKWWSLLQPARTRQSRPMPN